MGPGRQNNINSIQTPTPPFRDYTFDQQRAVAQRLRRLQHAAVGGEHRGAGQTELHQPQTDNPVVDVPELDAFVHVLKEMAA